jgi:peptidoglycan biosynthesis protein MviN/MurJ (putative lipid II flippase)
MRPFIFLRKATLEAMRRIAQLPLAVFTAAIKTPSFGHIAPHAKKRHAALQTDHKICGALQGVSR